MAKVYNKPQFELENEIISKQHLSECTGVFVLFNISGTPVYVGATNDLGSRLQGICESFTSYDFFSFWKCESLAEADRLALQIFHDFDLLGHEDVRENVNSVNLTEGYWDKLNRSQNNTRTQI